MLAAIGVDDFGYPTDIIASRLPLEAMAVNSDSLALSAHVASGSTRKMHTETLLISIFDGLFDISSIAKKDDILIAWTNNGAVPLLVIKMAAEAVLFVEEIDIDRNEKDTGLFGFVMDGGSVGEVLTIVPAVEFFDISSIFRERSSICFWRHSKLSFNFLAASAPVPGDGFIGMVSWHSAKDAFADAKIAGKAVTEIMREGRIISTFHMTEIVSCSVPSSIPPEARHYVPRPDHVRWIAKARRSRQGWPEVTAVGGA